MIAEVGFKPDNPWRYAHDWGDNTGRDIPGPIFGILEGISHDLNSQSYTGPGSRGLDTGCKVCPDWKASPVSEHFKADQSLDGTAGQTCD
jgi:hypothetical protein